MKPLFELERNNVNYDWQVMKIKRVLDIPITDGPHETPELLEDGVPFLSAESVKNGNLNFDLKRGYISQEDHEKYIKKCKPQRDDIFMVKSGATTGNIAMVDTDEEFSIWSPLALIRAKKEIVIPKYLYYFVGSLAFREQVEVSWSYGTQQNIGMKVIENLFISIPSLEIQKRIVRYIEYKVKDIDILIKQKGKFIKLLEQQRQSILTEAVTKGLNPNMNMKDSGVKWIGEIPEHWEVKKVKHFAIHVGSGKTPSGGAEIYLDEGIPFLRSLNVHFDGIHLKDLAFISEEINEEMKTSQVQPLDILLNITGASIGRTTIVPKDFGRANVNQHVCIIRLNQNKVYPYYFNMLMASDVINQQIWFAQNGSSREGLNFAQVRELIFAIPPTLEEQREINEWIYNKQMKIFNLINLVKEQIEKLKEYRQSLIYEAVTGKIDVRELELD
ncbi:Type 1 restriction-modification system (S) endonuclease subunit [Alkalihalophilus pseudofirmus OF4]|uniref:Type 1 restriction-modification system (S) endonuclease subunit n=1 Tax=Alkalihalophilus pseudofirmus (strain ATCC BAA-2126 / JCM 17055 / OF4) TaxID=398511 RepID=D3FX57_ALKPO|nr:restriction endonuclease subunit S [Alkalihalophilus pseudofirmus]ADC48812.1 Type 1 restriction-modification system (S) endonuclease subunit [Alkalihalophilus pseudofirmus OF4]